MKIRASALVFGLLATVSLLMAVAAALGLRQSYQDALDRLNGRALTAAQGIAAQTRWMMVALDQSLSRMDDALGDSLSVDDATRAQIFRLIRELPADVDGWVMDVEGRPVFSTIEEAFPVSPVDRPYFKHAREGVRLYISPLFVRRSSGVHTFVVSRRLERNGQFAGLVALYVPASILARNLEKLELGPDSTVSVFRADGELVARHPPPSGPINLRNYVLFTKMLHTQSAGSYEAISPADGVRRVVGFASLEGGNLVGLASIGWNGFFAPYRETVIRAIAALGFILTILAATFAWLLQVLRREDRQRRDLAAALDKNHLLLGEIHHRVKNNLMAVSAMIQLEDLPRDLKDEMIGRIQAMAAIQEQTYRLDQYEHIQLAPYLSTLVQNMRVSYGPRITIEQDLEDIVVSRDSALPLGLIANEVMTNAFKHAFPDGRSGRITLTLRRSGTSSTLMIHDNGVGVPETSTGKGFGSQILRRFAQQLGGDVTTTRENGTIFSIAFPIRD